MNKDLVRRMISCRGMYQYEGVDWLIAKEYAPLPEGGFKRMGADVLRLSIPSVHPEFLALASPFLLHSVMTNGDALEEWLEELEAPLDPMAQADIVFARIAREQGG